MSSTDWQGLVQGFLRGAVSRRAFVSGALAMGASAGVIATALAAETCGCTDLRAFAANQTDSATPGPAGPILPDDWVGPRYAPPAGPISAEKVTLKVVVPQDQNVGDWEANAFTQWYEERTNVHIEWQEIAGTEEERRTVVNAMIAGGDLPDVFMSLAFRPAQLLLYGQQGLFTPLQDLIEQHGVEIKHVFEEYPLAQQTVTAPDGNIYHMPNVNDCYHCKDAKKLWIYKPWLDKLGLGVPQTTDELHAALKAFKEQDPNGDGKDDEVPFMSATDTWVGTTVNNGSIDAYFMGSFLYNPGQPWLIVADNQVDVVFNKPGWREGLKYLNQLYAEGLIAPDTFTQIGEQLIKVGNNPDDVVLGSAMGGYWGVFLTIDQNTEGARWSDYVTVPPVAGPDGTQIAGWDYYGAVNPNGQFVVTSACKTPDIAVKWADGMYELEAICRSYAGILGEDWRWADEGEEGIYGKQGVWKQLVTWSSDQMRGHWWGQNGVQYRSSDFRLSEVVDPAKPTFEKPLYEETKANYSPYAQDSSLQLPPLYFTEEQASQIGELGVTINNFVLTSLAQFVTGQTDPNDDGAWDDYVNTLNQMDLETYLKLHNDAFSSRGGA